MGVTTRHILHQGQVLGALARAGFIAIKGAEPTAKTPQIPGPVFTNTVEPRAGDLVADYIRFTGGDRGAYRGHVPAHLFPQWVFPLQTKTLEGLQYPFHKVINGGCRLEMNAPLPAGKPWKVTAQLVDVDDNGARALIHQKAVTGTADNPEALVAHMYVFVPLGGQPKSSNGAPKKKKKKKEPPRVAPTAREIGFRKIPANAGLDFAKLTGDFNPIHWIPPAARASGFRNVILHGFATLAFTIEAINRTLYAGDPNRLAWIDVQFTRPLVLPAKVGVYVEDNAVYVGDAPGGPAYLVGTFAGK